MKKLFMAVIMGTSLSVGAAMADTPLAPVDAQAAINTFGSDLQNIRAGLDKGIMQPSQALVLLNAILARQNQVIIAQNEEIIQLLQAQQKGAGSK